MVIYPRFCEALNLTAFVLCFFILSATKSSGALLPADLRSSIQLSNHAELSQIASADTVPQPGDSAGKIFEIRSLERLPQFKGGMQGWSRFLQANLKFPQQAKDRQISGQVILKFVIEKDGSITDLQVVKSPDVLLSQEAMRVVKRSPKWIPGLLDGQPVRVGYTMPIIFSFGIRSMEPSNFPVN